MIPKFSIKLTVIYLFLGIAWILGSDRLVQYLAYDSHTLSHLQNFKGLFFILITAILLFLLTRHEEKKRKAIIDKLNKALHEAEIASRLKVSFLGNISHEIRTPLNAIRGFSQILRNAEIEPKEMKEFPQIIIKNVDHLLSILEIILEASKLQSESISPDFRKINIGFWLKKTITEFNSSNNIKLELTTSDPYLDSLPQIDSDPAILNRCLILLTDGVKRFVKSDIIEVMVNFNQTSKIISLCFKGRYDIDKMNKAADFFQPFNLINERLPNADYSIGNELYMSKKYGELLQASFSTKTEKDSIIFCLEIPIPA